MELDIVGWTPGVNSYLDRNLNWLPNSIKDWVIDLWNKIYYFISKIWNWFTEFLGNILNKILEILKGRPNVEKEPVKMPDKFKLVDGDNEYLNNLIQTLDEYKIYILISIGVIAIGILTYTYWDSISTMGRRGGGNNGDNPDVIIPSPIPSDPSSGRDTAFYPEGYLQNFSRRLGDLTAKVKTRAGELYSFSRGNNTSDGISNIVSHPKGLYREGNQVMWEGLPVPRVENLNGLDYYISLDKDNYINMFNSTNAYNSIDIINPIV
jgi:hypothetical protein